MSGGDLYTFTGKQVLSGGEHYADAANELAAEIIVGALNCDASGIVAVLRRNDAEKVAADLRAKLPMLTGAKNLPLPEDDPAWVDLVQHIIRRAAEIVGARGQ